MINLLLLYSYIWLVGMYILLWIIGGIRPTIKWYDFIPLFGLSTFTFRYLNDNGQN